MPDTDRTDLALIAAAARAAGALALEHFRGAPRRWNKPDDTVVTEADIAVDKLLRDQLTAERPGYGWLSEEQPDDGSRHDAERVFVVDPIDGTRAFIDGSDEWVVSIGLVTADTPVAGVLYNPVRDELWSAVAGGGAWLDETPLHASGDVDLATAPVAASHKAFAQAGLEEADFTTDRRFLKSLAHRLARVAGGGLGAALATSGSADWDIAAALLLVREAGGRITYLDGKPIRLNQATTRHHAFVAAGPHLYDAILSAVAQGKDR